MDIRFLAALSALTLISPAALCADSETPTQTPYAEREEVRLFARDLASREGLDEAKILGALAEAHYLPSVVKAILPPASPVSRSWVRYRARFLDRPRITGGLGFWKLYSDALARAEKQYGVPAEIIVAIIGIESIYGRGPGNYQTLSALATLAFDYPPRAELFRSELGELFVLARDQRRDVASFKGSYAGAIGLPQFMPSSIMKYAVDFDGDSHIDLRNSTADAIGSVAHFLVEHGWRRDDPAISTYRVTVSSSHAWEKFIGQGLQAKYRLEELQEAGISTLATTPQNILYGLIDLQNGSEATEYHLASNNFFAITQYNRSYFYAMSVIDLGKAISQVRAR